MNVSAVLLAAGQGTRMKSKLPKVLHPIAGRPMIWHAVEAIRAVSAARPVVVIGRGADEVTRFLGEAARTVLQEQQLGTAHAVMQAEPLLKGKTDLVVVCYADMPLLRSETLQKLVDQQKANPGPLSILTVLADDPRGFGRILRNVDGTVRAIVEEYVATPEQLQINELNVGGYCFSSEWLWDALPRIPLSPKGEYYLTDAVELAVKDDLAVQATRLDDPQETIGVNTRVHLAEVESAMRRRINAVHMLNGVTLIDPATTYIDAGVTIGTDTVVRPNTHLHGSTEIGEENVLGPDAIIRDTKIGDRCKVLASVLDGARLEDEVDVGPFARLRRGAHLASGVHMGNFGEVKDSYLAPGVKMGHFSYIGNAKIGANTNIGAGVITCNFDGENKNATEIGEDAFIGSDTMLVAPVTLGDRSRTGAGAVVTRDIPADTLAVGMPARNIRRMKARKES